MKETIKYSKKLLEITPIFIYKINLDKINETPGVYLIYNGNNKIIYVGETKNLNRRIKGDISRGKKRYHSLLSILAKKYNLKDENEVKKFVLKKLKISFIEVNNTNMCKLIEAFLITYLRKNKILLLNKIK